MVHSPSPSRRRRSRSRDRSERERERDNRDRRRRRSRERHSGRRYYSKSPWQQRSTRRCSSYFSHSPSPAYSIRPSFHFRSPSYWRRYEKRSYSSCSRSSSPETHRRNYSRSSSSDLKVGGESASRKFSNYDHRSGGDRDHRHWSRSRSRSPVKDSSKTRPVIQKPITEADLQGKTPDEQEMMKAMGFCSFDTTKGKKVEGNDVGAVHVILKRKYRQYMNRKGGFNRPLDFVA